MEPKESISEFVERCRQPLLEANIMGATLNVNKQLFMKLVSRGNMPQHLHVTIDVIISQKDVSISVLMQTQQRTHKEYLPLD